MAIGEAGSITTNSPTENQPITVNLTQPLENPVFALSATNNGGNQFVLRITDQTYDTDGNTTSFTFIIEEWEYHDGPHGATETINWIAIEEGTHTLPDGRIIEAGTSSVNDGNTSVSLTAGFPGTPTVLTSVMSENDTTTVDSDPFNVTSSGFTLSLQEEEAEDGTHANETVGWIAIQQGGDATSGTATNHGGLDEGVDSHGLGATFGDAIVVAETQTINGGDTATVVIDGQTNSTVDLFLEEEQSNDNEMNHINETVGIVAFEEGLIPCFTRGTLIETDTGPRPIEDLGPGDLIRCANGQCKPLALVLSSRIDAQRLEKTPALRPVRIRAGALGHGVPTSDLMVSQQHRMLTDSPVALRMFGSAQAFVIAKKLTSIPGIEIDQHIEEVEYFHLLMPRHEVIFAHGAATESLLPGPQALRMFSGDTRRMLGQRFPRLFTGKRWHPARFVPNPRKQAALAKRMASNARQVMVARSLARPLGRQPNTIAGE